MINIRDELRDKEFRAEYSAENIRTGIAYQIRALREKRGWSQKKLGEEASKPQNVISRLENPEYGKLNIQTLNELAAAFDVALLVRFVSFGELTAHVADLSPEALAVPEFSADPAFAAVREKPEGAEALSEDLNGQPGIAEGLSAAGQDKEAPGRSAARGGDTAASQTFPPPGKSGSPYDAQISQGGSL
jgi:transcriptional regulator with XRE-family HTH domain